ncbi:hypothetical protein K440DRAFT_646100 [Wilcoxina mikolae CBS 423.85]|nr:hypothetical protein K440DRAFT_646100 [Wilcoxina mikolae CBS 423.85]
MTVLSSESQASISTGHLMPKSVPSRLRHSSSLNLEWSLKGEGFGCSPSALSLEVPTVALLGSHLVWSFRGFLKGGRTFEPSCGDSVRLTFAWELEWSLKATLKEREGFRCFSFQRLWEFPWLSRPVVTDESSSSEIGDWDWGTAWGLIWIEIFWSSKAQVSGGCFSTFFASLAQGMVGEIRVEIPVVEQDLDLPVVDESSSEIEGWDWS